MWTSKIWLRKAASGGSLKTRALPGGSGFFGLKSDYGLRLWLLASALILVCGGVICAMCLARQRIRQLETKLTSVTLGSFRLSGEVHRNLLALNDSLLRYVLLRDEQLWGQFEATSSQLDRWIDKHDPALNPHSPVTTAEERRLFTNLNQAYADYLAAGRAVHTNQEPALAGSKQLLQLAGFEAQAERMRHLTRQLSEAHRAAEGRFLASANASLSRLQVFLVAAVTLMLALVAVLGWVIFRDAVAPLRMKLVASQTLLERREKLAVLGTLAAGIAHEIRNPLTSLKARLYTLDKHLQTPPAARRDTEIIGAEIDRLERIVRDVLSFAQPFEPKLEMIAADTVLCEVKGLMAPNLEARSVALTVEARPGLAIQADSGHLKQVLVNLVRNAAEAIEGGGAVTLRARGGRALLHGDSTDAVIIEVSDTGRGIPPEVEKRLFDPFFSTKESGTGLGLSIAARIVEKHGGALQYQTQPGQGTTFGVVLPLARLSAAPVPLPACDFASA
jgi:signal transduction histidine kinase